MLRRNRLPTTTLLKARESAPDSKCGPPPRFPLTRVVSAPALWILLLGGCYTYAETPLSSLSPGLQARVSLTEDGFGRIVNQAAENGVPVDMFDMSGRGVVGRVMTLGPSGMTVQVRGAGGSVFAADVPTQAVQQVAVRTFSSRRTIGAVVGGAVLFAAIYAGTTGGTTSTPPPPEPEQMVVPVSSILGRILGTTQSKLILDLAARLGSGR